MWDNFQFFMMVAGYPSLCLFWWRLGIRNGVGQGVRVTLDFMEKEGLVKFEPDEAENE
jgi:hypothetical protein